MAVPAVSPDVHSMPPSLRGRRAWVVGASRGLGRAVALGLAAAGADLVLSARTADSLSAVAEDARALGVTAHVLPLSVADPGGVRAAGAEIGARWTGLDVLVNCAGISPTFKRAELLDDDEWRNVIDVNLSGAFFVSRAAAELMLASGGGSIIHTSSVHAHAGMPRLAAYSASKGGTEAVARTLALEWAKDGIRVNSVAPGYFETEMTEGLRGNERLSRQLLERIPMGRFGVPSEVVSAYLYLASDESAYVTGSTMFVDGGWTAA